MNKTILVLGKTGMAGHMIFDYFTFLKKYNVIGTTRKEFEAEWEYERKKEILKEYKPDYVINCIGIINKYADENPEKTIRINGCLPHTLGCIGHELGYKLIHISSDCYRDSDVYGKTKRMGEAGYDGFGKTLTIRTSIIGPELKDGFGLFHWFMTQEGEVSGYTKAMWDGVTTLQLAMFMEECIEQEKDVHGVIDYRVKVSISKCDLLRLIAEVFNKKIKIKEDDREMKDKRNPDAEYKCEQSYKHQLEELKNFMGNSRTKYQRYFR